MAMEGGAESRQRSRRTILWAGGLLLLAALVLIQVSVVARRAGGLENVGEGGEGATELISRHSFKMDSAASTARCVAIKTKTKCLSEPIVPNVKPVQRLCWWAFGKCKLSSNYGSYYTNSGWLISHEPPGSGSAGDGGAGDGRRTGRADDDDDDDGDDEDAVDGILGDLTAQPKDSDTPKYTSSSEYEGGEPYGGLRLWSPEKQLFLRHNYDSSAWDRWNRRGTPRLEWCNWGEQMVPCAPGFGGAWYVVGHRRRDGGIWPEEPMMTDPEHKKLQEQKQKHHVYAGKRSHDYWGSS